MKIEIDSNACKKCLTCTNVCNGNHLFNNNGSPEVDNGKECISCLHCVSSCTEGAVKSKGILVNIIPAGKGSPVTMRRSHRHYKNKPVDKDTITDLINKANTAPVMGGLRDERLFTVVSDKELIRELRSEILGIIKKYRSLFNILRKVLFFYPVLTINYSQKKISNLSNLFYITILIICSWCSLLSWHSEFN